MEYASQSDSQRMQTDAENFASSWERPIERGTVNTNRVSTDDLIFAELYKYRRTNVAAEIAFQASVRLFVDGDGDVGEGINYCPRTKNLRNYLALDVSHTKSLPSRWLSSTRGMPANSIDFVAITTPGNETRTSLVLLLAVSLFI